MRSQAATSLRPESATLMLTNQIYRFRSEHIRFPRYGLSFLSRLYPFKSLEFLNRIMVGTNDEFRPCVICLGFDDSGFKLCSGEVFVVSAVEG